METISCVFCGPRPDGLQDPVAIHENGWNGRQCTRCGLIYISPRPSPSEVERIYTEDRAHTDSATLTAGSFHTQLCAAHSIRLLTKYAKGGDLLEIGSGAGFFLAEVARDGRFRPYGIEPNHVQCRSICARGLCCTSESLSRAFQGHRFDVIYHCDVTSHFSDPLLEFRLMGERLKDGGVLMFETGNMGDVNPRYYKSIKSFQYPDHLFFLSTKSLAELLNRSGFSLVHLYRYSREIDFRLFKALRRLIGGGAVNAANGGHSPQERNRTMHRMVGIIHYALTYCLGAVLPKHSEPQTLIAVAVKRPTENS